MSHLFARVARVTKHEVGRFLRELGIQYELKGAKLTKDIAHHEPLSRHQKIKPIDYLIPEFCETTTLIADSATVIGNVNIGKNSSIWYGAVIRGDDGPVRIGDNATIGDQVKIYNNAHLPAGVPAVTIIGSIVRSSIVDDNCVVGENCYLMDGARIERGSYLADNSVLAPGVCIPAGQHWAGNPAAYQGEYKAAVTHLVYVKVSKSSDNKYVDEHREI